MIVTCIIHAYTNLMDAGIVIKSGMIFWGINAG